MENWQETMEFLVGTPLYLLVSVGFLVFVVYYFWKIAPKRYEDYRQLNAQSEKNNKMLETICQQYDKTLDSITRVIENNTAALQNTQAILQLTAERASSNIQEIAYLENKIDSLTDKVTEASITLAKIVGYLEKNN